MERTAFRFPFIVVMLLLVALGAFMLLFLPKPTIILFGGSSPRGEFIHGKSTTESATEGSTSVEIQISVSQTENGCSFDVGVRQNNLDWNKGQSKCNPGDLENVFTRLWNSLTDRSTTANQLFDDLMWRLPDIIKVLK